MYPNLKLSHGLCVYLCVWRNTAQAATARLGSTGLNTASIKHIFVEMISHYVDTNSNEIHDNHILKWEVHSVLFFKNYVIGPLSSLSRFKIFVNIKLPLSVIGGSVTFYIGFKSG